MSHTFKGPSRISGHLWSSSAPSKVPGSWDMTLITNYIVNDVSPCILVGSRIKHFCTMSLIMTTLDGSSRYFSLVAQFCRVIRSETSCPHVIIVKHTAYLAAPDKADEAQ